MGILNDPRLFCTLVCRNSTGGTLLVKSNIAEQISLLPGKESDDFLFFPSQLLFIEASFSIQGSEHAGRTSVTWPSIEDKYVVVQQINDDPAIAVALIPKIPKRFVLTVELADDGILLVGTIDVQGQLPPDVTA